MAEDKELTYEEFKAKNGINYDDMIVIDDYENGIIMAGGSDADLRDMTPNMKKCVQDLINGFGIIEDVHFKDDNEDFYVFRMDPNKLLKYMAERDCLNFIKGV